MSSHTENEALKKETSRQSNQGRSLTTFDNNKPGSIRVKMTAENLKS